MPAKRRPGQIFERTIHRMPARGIAEYRAHLRDPQAMADILCADNALDLLAALDATGPDGPRLVQETLCDRRYLDLLSHSKDARGLYRLVTGRCEAEQVEILSQEDAYHAGGRGSLSCLIRAGRDTPDVVAQYVAGIENFTIRNQARILQAGGAIEAMVDAGFAGNALAMLAKFPEPAMADSFTAPWAAHALIFSDRADVFFGLVASRLKTRDQLRVCLMPHVLAGAHYARQGERIETVMSRQCLIQRELLQKQMEVDLGHQPGTLKAIMDRAKAGNGLTASKLSLSFAG